MRYELTDNEWFAIKPMMHTDNRSVDHLDSGIVGSCKRIYDTAPEPAPRQRTKRL
ncbi:hypothetical protein GGD67_002299 [Bradyrhizobium sp. IAR9]|uniref:hypothetical protein n=1 Tax=Bradyrhizobium sp. IAR9 TaxID=2663841 RepID=UPI00183BA8AC|nr:hypothetical protein [Bradyrhizobium sp. IAR9]